MKSLDLHGISHESAKVLVVTFIDSNLDKLPIEIITGNSNYMKKIVLDIVNKYDLKASPKNYYNLGCLVINN
ncbi:MAG: hypothetical protein CBD97_02615 [Pelagibacteraceae bacterium TMED237]|nr:hypothetical protein [Candidatus Neomarinimicrobiota bacterium]OUW95599.1 MAG: hypothetical protein CBD97_02615 [Pelagibacteraceae bacterium TMED237]|tara:strand:- start:2674 stop:2889 length:216 start_codon:yes stop_codon:yes gene_type:complete